MKNQKVLELLSRLIADAYSQIVLCPLEEEQALLLSTGRQSPESFFEACRLVFGLNQNKAFETVCIHVTESCEFLLYTLQHGMAGNSADSLIASAENQVAAIGFLAEHAPMDSFSDQAMLCSLLSPARLCLKSIQARRRQRPKN
ncbi:MAG: hypothetical protein SPD88_06925 [Candidatus Ventricola sp.]|nr:hypothetical protein [Candidatus Ventricola sp.]